MKSRSRLSRSMPTRRSAGQVTAKSADLVGQGVQGFFAWINNTFRGQSKEFNYLLGMIIALVVFGLVMVLSASYVVALSSNSDAYSIFGKQLISAILGFGLLGFMSRVPVRALQKIAPYFFLTFLVVQLLVLFVGTSVYGNKNWIKIFGLSVQPSEFLKVALILVISGMLYQRRDYFDDVVNTWVFPLAAMFVALVLVLGGKDLGTGMVMFGLSFVLMILAGMPTKLIWTVLIPVLLIVGFLASSGSRKARIVAWLNPDAPDHAIEFFHGYTYSGHPVSSAVALRNIEIMEREGLVDKVRNETGPYLAKALASLDDHPLVGETRSVGLLGAVEIVADKATGARFGGAEGTAGPLVRDICIANGLMVRGIRDSIVMCPPLIISTAQIDELVGIIRKSLDKAEPLLRAL